MLNVLFDKEHMAFIVTVMFVDGISGHEMSYVSGLQDFTFSFDIAGINFL